MEIKINLPTKNKTKNYDDLFDVWMLDYGDNYHRRGESEMSELERQVRNLKGRYRDIIRYNEALIIYNDWMDFLTEKYGNRDILKKMIANGLVEEYVPRKPRLKNTKTLKYLYKHKIIVSSCPSGGKIKDEEAFNEYLNTWFPEDSLEDPTVTIRNDKLADKIASEFDASSYYKTYSFESDAQYLENYFANKNKKGKKKKGKKKNKKIKKDPILIQDIIDGLYSQDDNYDDESDNSYATPYGTLLLSGSRTKEMEMWHRINEAGWNSYKIMKHAKYSKRERDLFKPVKKAKKKSKKKAEKMMKQLGVEDTLVQIFEDMGYDDFEDYEKEMLSMTSEDMAREMTEY